jgi:hypothetical protein
VLRHSARAVQAAHAALAHKRGYRLCTPEGASHVCPTIALLQVDDGVAIESWYRRIGEHDAAIFHEPDLGFIPAALAYYGEDRFDLSQLRLMG